MTRLLFAEQYGEMGGGQRVLMSLLRAAMMTGFEVNVLAPGGGALQTAIAAEFGSSVTFITCEEPRLSHGRKGLADVFALLAYGWRFRRHMPLLDALDVIYVNGLRHLPHMLMLTRGMKARIIYHVHICHSRAEKYLLRIAARASNTFRIVVNSRFVQETLGIISHRVCLIENALDAGFAARPYSDRFTGAKQWVAAVLGTLRPEKGQDCAVTAMARRRDMALHIIGRDGDGAGNWIASLKQAAGANVHFDGAVPDAAQAIEQLGVQFNLVPSRWDEPFGLVAIEGMACSCLTIVSGRGGLAEIAGRTGALTAPDAESLRSLLDELCTRPPSALAAIAREQYDKTLSHYAPDRFKTEVRGLLMEAAREKAPDRAAY